MSDLKSALTAIEQARKTHSTELNLSVHHLYEVPEKITKLSWLKKLDLRGNNLTTFPEIIFQLPELEILDISSNDFKKLPNNIGDLQNIEKLSLTSTHITSVPSSFKKLVRLKSLDLGFNSIAEFPKAIIYLSALEDLSLMWNGLKKIPDEIGNLKKLRKLNLSHNKIESLPLTLSYFENLVEIDLAENQLQEFPKELLKLKFLEIIDLKRNKIKSIPEKLSSEKRILSLSLGDNLLVRFPEVVLKCEQLISLSLNGNKLDGIPDGITKLINLRKLDISQMGLKYIPESIGALPSLASLSVNDNEIEELPDNLGELKNLWYLNIDRNRLKELPVSITALPKLKFLHFRQNPLKSDFQFNEEGFIGIYRKLRESQLQRVKVKVIEVADSLKGVFQEYLAGFENFLKETERILIRFSTKQVEKGLELEIELPVVHDQEMESSIQRAFDKYLALIHPANQDRLKDLLDDYFKEASKYTILHYQNKIDYFQKNLLVTLEEIAEKQNELLSGNEKIESLKGLLQGSIKSNESHRFETTDREMEVKELVSAAKDFKNFIDPSLKFELPTEKGVVYLKYDDIIMFQIKDSSSLVYCYNLNRKGINDKIEPDIPFNKIPLNYSIAKIIEMWARYFIWVNKQTVINPRHIYSKYNDGESGVIEMDHIGISIPVSRDKRTQIWQRIQDNPSLKP